MSLSVKHLQVISQSVYRKFPEVAGARPSVRPQSLPTGKRLGEAHPGPHYLLTFKSIGSSPEGRLLPRFVRVVVDEEGRIIKISTSR